MATFAQRFDTILTGTLDAAPTAGQKTKVADAYTAQLSDRDIVAQFGAAHPPAVQVPPLPPLTAAEIRPLLTTAEKATIVVNTVRDGIKNRVREYNKQLATPAASATVVAAGDTAVGDL